MDTTEKKNLDEVISEIPFEKQEDQTYLSKEDLHERCPASHIPHQ